MGNLSPMINIALLHRWKRMLNPLFEYKYKNNGFGYIERLEPIETVLDGYQNTIYKRKTQAKNYQK